MTPSVEAGVARVVVGPRHAYDRYPTPEWPAVRVFPAIPWMDVGDQCWVRDSGADVDIPVVGPFTTGTYHGLEDTAFFPESCDVCKKRPSFRYDDFFGNLCPLCEITHRLRYKARGVNPWGGKAAR